MQQRVGLARALANDPEVLLMDEAFSALDPLIRVQMQDELLALQSKVKKTIVFITHDLEEAVKLGDRIAIMRDGEIQQIGTSEEILTDPANKYVRCFVENVDRSRIITAASIMVDKPMGKEGPEVLIRKMRERKITVLPVVDPDGILVGEVHLKELLQLRKERILNIDSIVRKEVHSILGDTVVEDILPLMTKTNSPIWVVNEKREFEGMVPLSSLIIEVTGKDKEEINEIIQNAIEEWQGDRDLHPPGAVAHLRDGILGGDHADPGPGTLLHRHGAAAGNPLGDLDGRQRTLQQDLAAGA